MNMEEFQSGARDLEMKIAVGEVAQAQIEGRKYNTCFRGIAPSRWIFLDIPKHNGKRISLAKQQPLSIRYVHGGIVYGFRTKVNATYVSPYSILTVEFPRKIESFNLRRSERIKTFVPIRIRAPGSGEFFDAAMRNLSGEGALVSLNQGLTPEVGAMVLVSIELPAGVKAEDLPCVVKNVKKESGVCLVGVEFDMEKHTAFKDVRRFYDASVSFVC